MKVNLKIKPYCLEDKDISWVEDTIKNMSLNEKFEQLFFILTASKEENYLKEICEKERFGGVRYNPGSPKEIYNHNKILQENSKIPLLIAANTESGGNGACNGGTEIGNETKVAATNDLSLAYALGEVSAKEAKSLGINTIFAPIVDIHNNFHNPVISTRTFGNDPKRVKEMSLEFFKAIQKEGLISCAKHFPGDGYDERDQHLASSINPLSIEEWDNSFGEVYKSLIDEGLPMIMAGHIKLPSYQKYFNPSLTDKDIKPATLSKELITDLLKGKLGFNGLVVTDATHMVALTSEGKRSEFLPQIIASGCDMILFYNDYEEDIEAIKNGYKNGVITEERLNDALRRILGIKAKLHLNTLDKEKIMPLEEGLNIIGNEKHKNYSSLVSKKAITLVKNIEEGLLPISIKKNKRILVVIQEDENPFKMFMPKRQTIYEYFQEKMNALGYEVTIYESTMDKAKKLPPQEAFKLIMNVYGLKTPIKDLTNNYDLIIHFANFMSHNTVQRISWKLSKGTADIPWYGYELPTIFVSLNCPFHLFDVPKVKTYINCYDKNINTIDALIDKLTGKDEFVGISPVDAFCGSNDTKY